MSEGVAAESCCTREEPKARLLAFCPCGDHAPEAFGGPIGLGPSVPLAPMAALPPPGVARPTARTTGALRGSVPAPESPPPRRSV